MDHSAQTVETVNGSGPPRILLFFMRVMVPLIITAIGVVLVIMGHGRYKSVFANKDSLYSAMGVGAWIVALSIVLLNWMMRMNVDDAGERQAEEDARQFFITHGHWPDEAPRR